MPDDTSGPEATNVVVISAEDDPGDTIRPRFEAAGGDVARVSVLDPNAEQLLSFPEDSAVLEQFVVDHEVGLVILDPLNAFLGDGVGTNSDHSVRRALLPLARMATRTGVTIVVIRHLTKAKTEDPRLRGQGSIAFTGAVRSGLLVATRPEEPEVHYLAAVKHSLTARPPTLMFRAAEVPKLDTVKITWVGPAIDVTAADLLTPAGKGSDSPTMQCAVALRGYLTQRHGHAPAKEVGDEMARLGFSAGVVRRAKEGLGIESKRQRWGQGGTWEWHLNTERTLAVVAPIDAIDVPPTPMAPMNGEDGEPK